MKHRMIRFRAKRLDNREWVYGHYYQRYDITKEGIINQHYITEITRHHETKHHQINPKTLGQHIGLNDKNDNEIYEDDIWKDDRLNVIVFYKGAFQAQQKVSGNRNNWINLMWEWGNGEVIGNIHDNPELIEVKR